MSKNPHAVSLGRKGGAKKVPKGFATMPRKQAERIRNLALEARRKKKA